MSDSRLKNPKADEIILDVLVVSILVGLKNKRTRMWKITISKRTNKSKGGEEIINPLERKIFEGEANLKMRRKILEWLGKHNIARGDQNTIMASINRLNNEVMT